MSKIKFSVAFGVLALAALANGGVSMNNPAFCYMTDPIRSMTTMQAAQTSYEAVRRFNLTTVNPYISTCTPSRFWYLGRNAGHYPPPDRMQEMIDFAESSIQDDIVNNYNAGRTTLCRQDFEAIRDWTRGPDFVVENGHITTEAGVFASWNIAKRYQQRFPNILTETYSPNRFHFRYTSDRPNAVHRRTNATLRAFAAGLFGETESQNVVYEDIPERDWLLRSFEYCPIMSDVVRNYGRYQNAFQQGPEVLEMVENVNRKLGYHGSHSLNFGQVLIMWDWCRFETASTFEFADLETGGDSVWCAPFSVADHLVLEYHEELGQFHFSGYGVRNRRVLENLNCGLMQNLLNLIESDNDSNDTVARFFVTYIRPLLFMLVTFDAFRDTWPLHQHNYAQHTSRHWIMGLMVPVVSNLAVVRYDCDGDDDLVFLLNEKPLLLPFCDRQTGVCKASVFVNRFRRFIGVNCEVDFCSYN